MTPAELRTALKTLGMPVAYEAFISTPENPPPPPPFICYKENFKDAIMADNHNYCAIRNFDIELYTNKKDLVKEALVEALLKTNRLPNEGWGAFIETENMYQMVYKIQLIGG